jgi:quercetin dioxygenase-like cupin family protein
LRLFPIASVALSTLVLTATVASATPSRGVTGTIISRTTFGGKDYILREVTLAPGGSTGWHFHRGTLYGLVRDGVLTHSEADCTTTEVYPPGSTLIEPAGADRVHVGRNLATAPVVLEVLYVLPEGSPLSDDAADPGCGFD